LIIKIDMPSENLEKKRKGRLHVIILRR